MNPELKLRIEQYFHHKWNNDRNNAIRIDEVQYMIMNLPQEVSGKITTDFLFHKFVETFKHMFRVRKWKSMHQPCFFNHDDVIFSEFYQSLLHSLCPLMIDTGTRIFVEQQDVEELIFVCRGTYSIGFEINKREKLIIK
jgi:hypothetical protein